MAFNLENMTVDYKKLLNIVPTQRMQLAQSGAINDIIGALSPGQLVNLFPRYYREQLPDIGQTNKYASGLDVALSGAPLSSKSGGGVTTYGNVAAKAMTPEEKAVKEIFEKANLGNNQTISETQFVDPRTSEKVRPEILEKYKDKNLPVTIRNNNMGAISLADESNTFVTGMAGFIGMTPRPANEGGYYAKFASPEHGVAAASKNLENYGSKGINTPYAIVKKWARESSNPSLRTLAQIVEGLECFAPFNSA